MSTSTSTLASTPSQSRFYKKGLCGLVNLGNTCFMNSIIQCLNSNLDFVQFFHSSNYTKHWNQEVLDHHLLREWVILSQKLYEKNCVFRPLSFHKTMQILALKKGRGLFGGIDQNDSQEFLQFFMEALHTALAQRVEMSISGEVVSEFDRLEKRSFENWIQFFQHEYSFVVELFYGQFYSAITSPEAPQYKSDVFEPFSNLSLEIPALTKPGTLSIYDCLDHFCKPEKLDQHTPDAACCSQDARRASHFEKRVAFWKLPKYLVMFFKRYTNELRVNTTHIDFPLEGLDMSHYCAFPSEAQARVYDLHAVSNHSGSLSVGHYWACTKNADGEWYCFNDTIVTRQNPSRIASPSVYCLFYKQR